MTDPAEPDINQPTLGYIEHYVPDPSGSNYIPGITVGLVKVRTSWRSRSSRSKTSPFTRSLWPFVCQLGTNGTAYSSRHGRFDHSYIPERLTHPPPVRRPDRPRGRRSRSWIPLAQGNSGPSLPILGNTRSVPREQARSRSRIADRE